MKVWSVVLNVPGQRVGHCYTSFDVTARNIKDAVAKAQKKCKADGLGLPYVAKVELLSDPE